MLGYLTKLLGYILLNNPALSINSFLNSCSVEQWTLLARYTTIINTSILTVIALPANQSVPSVDSETTGTLSSGFHSKVDFKERNMS